MYSCYFCFNNFNKTLKINNTYVCPICKIDSIVDYKSLCDLEKLYKYNFNFKTDKKLNYYLNKNLIIITCMDENIESIVTSYKINEDFIKKEIYSKL